MFDLVSIIVPVFNGEESLDECICSLLAQTYRDVELLLIDDGSTDRTAEICDRWAKLDARIRVFHKENEGLSATRNFGLDRAEGEYIVFVDADDLVSPEMVDKAVRRIVEDGSDACLFKHYCFHEKEKLEKPQGFAEFPDNGVCDSSRALEMLFEGKIQNYAWARIVRRKQYKQSAFSFPVGRTMEDMASTYLLLSSCRKVSILNEPLYYYRQHPTSITGSWSHRNNLDAIHALREMTSFVSERYPDLATGCYNYAVKFIFYCWRQEKSVDDACLSISERLAVCENEIQHLVRKCGFGKLTSLNKVKYLALRIGLLRAAFEKQRV